MHSARLSRMQFCLIALSCAFFAFFVRAEAAEPADTLRFDFESGDLQEIGRASCRERVYCEV